MYQNYPLALKTWSRKKTWSRIVGDKILKQSSRAQNLFFSVTLLSRFLSADCPMLKLLGESIPFEIALGMNGRIWIHSKSVRNTIAIMNALSNSEFMTEAQMRTMVIRLVGALAGFWEVLAIRVLIKLIKDFVKHSWDVEKCDVNW